MKIKIIIIALMLISSISLAQWPVSSGSQGTITGTIGESRGNNGGRIHNGTDLTGTSTTVYAIAADRIASINLVDQNGANLGVNRNIVMANGITYIHVDILSSLASNPAQIAQINNGTRIVNLTQGQAFATMVTQPQIHVHVVSNNQNFLRNGFGTTGFTFTDNVSPQFGPTANSDAIRIYKNLVGNEWQAPTRLNDFVTDEGYATAERPIKIWGPVDIVANVYQQRITNVGNSGGGHLAPYQMGYKFTNLKDNSLVFDSSGRISFDVGFGGGSVTVASQAIYRLLHATNSDITDPYFIVSNKFLNSTAEEKNLTTDKYKDGDYDITVVAKGAKGSDAGAPELLTEKKVKVRLDNYKTYIRKVIVSDANSIVKYFAEWTELTRPSEGSITSLPRNSEPFKSGTTANILVSTSEKVPSLKLILPSGPDINLTPVGTDGIQWQGQFSIPSSSNRKAQLKFKAGSPPNDNYLYSLQLNQVDADVKRDQTTGNFTDQSQNSTDKNHELDVCPSDYPLALTVDVQNGQDVTLSASGGTPPYEFSKDEMPIQPNHHSTFSATNTYTIDFDKSYLFKVKDAGKCQAEKFYTLPKVDCNALTLSGGVGTDIKQVNLGTIPGTVTIQYEMYSVPDQITVTYRGASQTTGIVSGSGTLTVQHTIVAGQSNVLTITMFAPNPGTAWNYTVICPGSQRIAVASAEQGKEYEMKYEDGILNISAKNENSHSSYTLYYRGFGKQVWNSIEDVTLPYSLKTGGVETEVKLETKSASVFAKTGLNAYPNPSKGPLRIEYVAEKAGDIILNIYNTEGSILYNKQMPVGKGLNIINWEPTDGTSGAVLIKVMQEGKTKNAKVIIVP